MKVLIAGTFDLFHKGHEFFIESALEYLQEDSEFHVIIARDSSVQKIKNKIPEDSENIRQENIINFLHIKKKFMNKNVKFFVHLGDSKNFLKIPTEIQPHLICFGYDQEIPKVLLHAKKNGDFKNCDFKNCDPYFPEIYKTSKMITQQL